MSPGSIAGDRTSRSCKVHHANPRLPRAPQISAAMKLPEPYTRWVAPRVRTRRMACRLKFLRPTTNNAEARRHGRRTSRIEHLSAPWAWTRSLATPITTGPRRRQILGCVEIWPRMIPWLPLSASEDSRMLSTASIGTATHGREPRGPQAHIPSGTVCRYQRHSRYRPVLSGPTNSIIPWSFSAATSRRAVFSDTPQRRRRSSARTSLPAASASRYQR